MENFDYKILKFVCESDAEPVRACDIELKFGKAGHAAASSLYREHLISWASSEDDILFRDSYGIIKPTAKGLLEYERYRYDSQLKNSEKWRERVISYVLGVLTPLTVYLFTEFVIPLLCK